MADHYIESPPHVDEKLMRHISPVDLLSGFGEPHPPGGVDAAAAARLLRSDWAGADHPRPARDVARWAKGIRPGTETEPVLAAARDLLASGGIDFTDRSVGRSRLYGRHYLGELACLIQAHALTGEARYASFFAYLFDSWYDSRDTVRGDWPGLDVVWYSLGVSARSALIGRALLQFAKSPEVGDESWLRMLATLVGSARWLTEEHATFRHGNWQFGSACSLLQIGALAIDHIEAPDWLATARRRIEEHLVLDVYADGGHYERAPSYHTLCLTALQDAAVVAEQQLGWHLADEPKFAAMHDWLIAMSTADGWVPPFNDSHIVWTGDHLVPAHYLLGRADYKHLIGQWVPDERVCSLLAWLPPRPGRGDPYAEYCHAPTAPTARPTSAWLPGSRFAVLRAGTEPDDLQLSLNCGPLVEHELESHSHLTVLDFVLIGDGQPLLWEAGGPASYDDPDYYSWYRATAAHNALLVPGRQLADAHDATIDDLVALPDLDVLSAWHLGWGERHRRTLLLVHPLGATPYLVVDDELAGVEGFVEMLHSPQPWTPAPGRYVTKGHTGVLVVDGRADRVVAARVSEGVSSYPDKPSRGGRHAPLFGLARELRGPRARTVVIPFRGSPPDVTVGEDTELSVEIGDVTDRFRACSWVRHRGAELVAGASWRGQDLTSRGRRIAGGPGVAAVGARWTGTSVSALVETSGRAALRLYAPGAVRVSVEGVGVRPSIVGDDVSIGLPSAGRWQVQVEREVN